MQRHFFIGIKIPSHFEEQVEEYREKYRLRDVYKAVPRIEDLHVTLLYLGAVSKDLVPSLKQKLSAISENHSHFSLYVNGLSYFGSSSGPRVVYLSVDDSSELTSLQREINNTISKHLSLPLSDRFVPHATIAKKRKSTEKILIEKVKNTPIEVPVNAFSLFTIHPEKSPKYEAIESFKLDV